VLEVVISSLQCQSKWNAYGGTLSTNFDELISGGPLPPCKYSLPVLDISSTGGGSGSTPCAVTNRADDPRTVRVNYLPDNLASIFIDSRCHW